MDMASETEEMSGLEFASRVAHSSVQSTGDQQGAVVSTRNFELSLLGSHASALRIVPA